jgi:hypothetical protein
MGVVVGSVSSPHSGWYWSLFFHGCIITHDHPSSVIIVVMVRKLNFSFWKIRSLKIQRAKFENQTCIERAPP